LGEYIFQENKIKSCDKNASNHSHLSKKDEEFLDNQSINENLLNKKATYKSILQIQGQ